MIIDTKFYRETLSGYYESKSLHSEHLYQMISYLSNARAEGEDVEGIILYPEVGEPIRASYTILGMPVRMRTLDLARPWREIHNELQDLVRPYNIPA